LTSCRFGRGGPLDARRPQQLAPANALLPLLLDQHGGGLALEGNGETRRGLNRGDQKRAALNAWSAHLLAVAEGRLPARKVLPFSRPASGEV
jgi:hypothetical protein